MAEARREEQEEAGERRDLRDVRGRNQATDHLERTKPDHLPSSQGPLSSIRAAIKRTRTNSQTDHTRDRRRPEITIISAEPLDTNNWFTAGFPSPAQSGWSAGIQVVSQPPPSYDQVLKEKTAEEQTVRPTAAPRRLACTTTSATQTDPVKDDLTAAAPESGEALQLAKKSPVGKKPQKPPRPSLPKPAEGSPAAESRTSKVKVTTITSQSRNAERRRDPKTEAKQPNREEASYRSISSVTVHWDIPAKPSSASDSEPKQTPIPRPRIKSKKPAVTEDTGIQTLVVFGENCDNNPVACGSNSEDVLSNVYLKELLEVFGVENRCEENPDIESFLNPDWRGEDAESEMSAGNSQRNIRSRIQAFESQAASEDGPEQAKPQPLPRKPVKPPVATKPSVAVKHQPSVDHEYLTILPSSGPPTPAPKPPKKPVGLPVKDELETLLSKGRSRPSVLTRSSCVDEPEPSAVPPKPPLKPPKEPLKPNLNINNHNSAFGFGDNEQVESPSNPIPGKPQIQVESNGGSFARQTAVRRPTTIRVPSKAGSLSDGFQDGPPPLPAQKPVGSLKTSVTHKESPTPLPPSQDSLGVGPEHSLPPRRQSTGKPLPPRPPAVKPGPGRPPGLQATARSHSAPRETSPKPRAQKPHRKGLVLPPRPNPGHRLYNKYTLQLPHGIADIAYNGSGTGELSFQKNEVLLLLDEIDQNTYECQVGDSRGKVHKSRLKVITPIGPSADKSTQQAPLPAAPSTSTNVLKVQALHDFLQEGPGELGLKAGDIITNVEQIDSEWYLGTCKGSTGFFPINYVKVLSNSPKPLPERKAKPPPANVSGPRCVARFDFEGERSDELSFCEGDVIRLKAYEGQEWARGQIGAVTGIFPLNFVEVIEDLPPPPGQQQAKPDWTARSGMDAASSSLAEVTEPVQQASQTSVEWVVARYDFAGKSKDELTFKEGDRILITQHIDAEWSCGRLNSREGIFPRAFVESSIGGKQSSDVRPNEPTSRRGRALYDFTSDCDEELSLQVGDIISNLEIIDDEWLLGDLRGHRALVPRNYVEQL